MCWFLFRKYTWWSLAFFPRQSAVISYPLMQSSESLTFIALFPTAPLLNAASSCLLTSLTNTSGIIRPHVRSPYNSNMDCWWNLSSNAIIELVFSSFNTEASADYVNVYDGGSLSSHLIRRISGSSLPAPITSSSNKLYVTFTSDSSGNYDGFVAAYRGTVDLKIRYEILA